MGGLNFKEGIIHYYLFQKKLSNYLNKRNYEEDEYKVKEGFIIHPDWIDNWRKIIYYVGIKNYLDGINLNENSLNSNKDVINEYLENNITEEYILLFLSQVVRTNHFDITQKKIFNEDFLINMIPDDVYKALKINEKNNKIKIKYICKIQMIIFAIEDLYIIKIIISDASPSIYNEKIINITWKFFNPSIYLEKLNFLAKSKSEEINKYFFLKGIFDYPAFSKRDKDSLKPIYLLTNDDLFQNVYGNETIFNFDKNHDNNSIDNNTSQIIIKSPKEINFYLTQRPSFRGLDNVGATCYMNATLQCLGNIKPLTDYLLNPNKYSDIFNSKSECPLTIQYCQVLIGLYCDNSKAGSFSPQQFKNTIGDMNPLFQGVQANDSKDLIIFLLEVMNSELSKLHNKKYGIKKREDDIQMINPSDQNAVLNEFIEGYKYSHSSIIGDNLCGFQRNVFTCQKCGGISNNFNLFNILIFSLEATAKLFNLNNNYNGIPILTFDQCFQFLCKEEEFQETYCQNCKKTGKSKYKENIYLLPNFVIIILNRGKGNIFNCKVDIPEIFDSSQYEENMKNKKYELIGIVSHFGESGMGGHFIAFCKHSIDNKWRCYNDSTVADSQNDYLEKGTPYILFYKNINDKNNNNNNNQCNNNQFNNNQFNNNQFNNNQINNNQFHNNNNQYNNNQYNNNQNNNLGNPNPTYDFYNGNNNINNMNFSNQQQQQQNNNNQNINLNFIGNFQQEYNMENNFQGNTDFNNANFNQNINLNNNNFSNNIFNNMGNMNNLNNY